MARPRLFNNSLSAKQSFLAGTDGLEPRLSICRAFDRCGPQLLGRYNKQCPGALLATCARERQSLRPLYQRMALRALGKFMAHDESLSWYLRPLLWEAASHHFHLSDLTAHPAVSEFCMNHLAVLGSRDTRSTTNSLKSSLPRMLTRLESTRPKLGCDAYCRGAAAANPSDEHTFSCTASLLLL